MQQPPAFPQHMEHFNTQMMNISQDLAQQVMYSVFLTKIFNILLDLIGVKCFDQIYVFQCIRFSQDI